MASKPSYSLTVFSTNKITPHMQRVVLHGEDLADFPEHSESGYIKLLFSFEGKALTSEAEVAQQGNQILMRTYTVRAFDAKAKQLTVDFVLHPPANPNEPTGPASAWAESAQVGDQIVIAGPGATKLVNLSADWFFLAGDITALPAISCNLEFMPADAQGYAVIEIPDISDKQSIQHPAGVEIIWVVQDKANSDTNTLFSTIEALPWLAGKPFVWAACEFDSMRMLRKFFKQTRGVERGDIYISSYWKRGRTEDQHKIDKRKDAEELENK